MTPTDGTPPDVSALPARPPLLVLYVREGCHLCEDAMEAIGQVFEELGASRPALRLPAVELRDVDADEAVRALFGNDLPVVVLNDRVVFKHRIDAPRLRQLLEAPPAERPLP